MKFTVVNIIYLLKSHEKDLFMLSHNTCTVRSAHGPKATFSPERRQVLVQTGQGNQIATRLLSRGKEQESMCACVWCVRVQVLVIFHIKDFYSTEGVATLMSIPSISTMIVSFNH